MDKKHIEWKSYIIGAIISLVIAILIFVLIFFAMKRSILDGVGYGSIVLLASAAFMWISSEGFFDLFAYGFRQLGSMMFSKNPTQYNDYAGYKIYKGETRKDKPKLYLSVALVGVLELIAAFIIFIVSRH